MLLASIIVWSTKTQEWKPASDFKKLKVVNRDTLRHENVDKLKNQKGLSKEEASIHCLSGQKVSHFGVSFRIEMFKAIVCVFNQFPQICGRFDPIEVDLMQLEQGFFKIFVLIYSSD